MVSGAEGNRVRNPSQTLRGSAMRQSIFDNLIVTTAWRIRRYRMQRRESAIGAQWVGRVRRVGRRALRLCQDGAKRSDGAEREVQAATLAPTLCE